jgi:hypothetical protein
MALQLPQSLLRLRVAVFRISARDGGGDNVINAIIITDTIVIAAGSNLSSRCSKDM